MTRAAQATALLEAADPRDLTKGDRTRRKILSAARALGENGSIHSVTMRDIAEASGIGLGGIYFHFQSREALVAAVLLDYIEDAAGKVRAAVDALGEQADAFARLDAALRAHLRFVMGASLIEGLVNLQMRDSGQWAQHIADQRHYVRIFADLIRALAQEGRLRPGTDEAFLRQLLLGALNWVPQWYRPEGLRSLDAIADQLMAMVQAGALQPTSHSNAKSEGNDE